MDKSLKIMPRQPTRIDESRQLAYWTRQPESALVGSPNHFLRRLHLFCVMSLEEARRYQYDTYAYPPLEPDEVAIVKAYLARANSREG